MAFQAIYEINVDFILPLYWKLLLIPLEDRASASGSFLPVIATKHAGQTRCNWWSERKQLTVQVECKRVVNRSAISHHLQHESAARCPLPVSVLHLF